MLKVLFLILIVMSSGVFAQNEDKTPIDVNPEAVKYDEFGRMNSGEVKMRFDGFMVNLQREYTAQGWIINFGANREIARREKLIRSYINFRKLDSSRITFVNGGYRKDQKTELWIVPNGAALPISIFD